MRTKRFTQYGIFSIAILLPFLTFFSVKLIRSGISSEPETLIYSSVITILLLCLLLLYKLTIILDDKSVSFKMGIGLISKRYKIEDIKSCYPIKNSIVLGFGIRMLSNGWLYNVSGFKSIELHFHNKSSIVRIGTDCPEEVCNAIKETIGNNDHEETGKVEKKGFSLLHKIIFLGVITFIAAVLFTSTSRTKVILDEKMMKIKGIYGLTIPYEDLLRVDTISRLPAISIRTNGSAIAGILKGNFRLTDKSSAKLFIRKENPPFLVIRSKERVPVYLNFKEKERTIQLYKVLKMKIDLQ